MNALACGHFHVAFTRSSSNQFPICALKQFEDLNLNGAATYQDLTYPGLMFPLR